ncbi:MAG: methyltransferase domain-containing protein, partial [bacterium]|nr:methyltransferase domain-containing protein [bacterium]
EIGDAVHLRFPDENFDNAIFSNNGWTQIPEEQNRLKALREIFRVLKPGGHFIFTTHLRIMHGFQFLWIKQWLKLYLLKPLGFNFGEVDFGDRFFERESTGGKIYQKQFIHIPKTAEVARQIQKAGLNLALKEMAGRLGGGYANSYSPMFFVCRKPSA